MVPSNRKLNVFVLLAFSFFFITSAVLAGPGDKKSIEKAQAAVNNAAPDDWLTLAKSAELCIRKKANMKEAAEWLKKSIAIKKNAYNLSVMGDYYAVNHLPEEAQKYYIESMQTALAENINADTRATQNKLLKVSKSNVPKL